MVPSDMFSALIGVISLPLSQTSQVIITKQQTYVRAYFYNMHKAKGCGCIALGVKGNRDNFPFLFEIFLHLFTRKKKRYYNYLKIKISCNLLEQKREVLEERVE